WIRAARLLSSEIVYHDPARIELFTEYPHHAYTRGNRRRAGRSLCRRGRAFRVAAGRRLRTRSGREMDGGPAPRPPRPQRETGQPRDAPAALRVEISIRHGEPRKPGLRRGGVEVPGRARCRRRGERTLPPRRPRGGRQAAPARRVPPRG